jgi:hypothetical protein
MTLRRFRAVIVFSFLTLMAMGTTTYGHGVAGKRFFPTTLVIDDPFMSDEFSILYARTGRGRESMMSLNSASIEWSKRIFPDFGFAINENYMSQVPAVGATTSGFDNLGVGLKYQFLTDDDHESILAVGIDGDLGGTGSRLLGAEPTTTLTPGLFFGKGFGDLPGGLSFLRPLAITGLIGKTIPLNQSGDEASGALEWGFTVQYSLQYLESYVKDVGLGAPFDRMIILAEFPFETSLYGPRRTSSSANIGATWFGRNFQLGAEVQFPLTETAKADQGTGILVLAHLFIDDLFPGSLGRSVFE